MKKEFARMAKAVQNQPTPSPTLNPHDLLHPDNDLITPTTHHHHHNNNDHRVCFETAVIAVTITVVIFVFDIIIYCFLSKWLRKLLSKNSPESRGINLNPMQSSHYLDMEISSFSEAKPQWAVPNYPDVFIEEIDDEEVEVQQEQPLPQVHEIDEEEEAVSEIISG